MEDKPNNTKMPWWVNASATLGVGAVVGFIALFVILKLLTDSQEHTQAKDDTNQEFIHGKLIGTVETTSAKAAENSAKSDAAMNRASGAMEKMATSFEVGVERLSGKIDAVVDKQDELVTEFKPLMSKLDKVANAVTEQTKQEAAQPVPAPN